MCLIQNIPKQTIVDDFFLNFKTYDQNFLFEHYTKVLTITLPLRFPSVSCVKVPQKNRKKKLVEDEH